jgi:hypothetical protein
LKSIVAAVREGTRSRQMLFDSSAVERGKRRPHRA